MIITRAPLRITLGGGGTDTPAYYERHGGACIAAAIDRYIYITVNRVFTTDFIVRYSRIERVATADRLEHPIVREAMALLELDGRGMEITSMADIHTGTGLGSSGAFTVALLKALHAYRGDYCSPHQIAEEACHIEINRLKEPIGKQDQYMAAFGGLTRLSFERDGHVLVWPVTIDRHRVSLLEDNLLLFYTGITRSASDALREQWEQLRNDDAGAYAALHHAKLSYGASADAIAGGDMKALGEQMDAHWQAKRARNGMSNEAIDRIYELGMRSGAIGGKLVGAGGGGFLLFVAHDRAALRRAMQDADVPEVRVRFDHEGVKILSI